MPLKSLDRVRMWRVISAYLAWHSPLWWMPLLAWAFYSLITLKMDEMDADCRAYCVELGYDGGTAYKKRFQYEQKCRCQAGNLHTRPLPMSQVAI
jgi:hypothetical protein